MPRFCSWASGRHRRLTGIASTCCRPRFRNFRNPQTAPKKTRTSGLVCWVSRRAFVTALQKSSSRIPFGSRSTRPSRKSASRAGFAAEAMALCSNMSWKLLAKKLAKPSKTVRSGSLVEVGGAQLLTSKQLQVHLTQVVWKYRERVLIQTSLLSICWYENPFHTTMLTPA